MKGHLTANADMKAAGVDPAPDIDMSIMKQLRYVLSAKITIECEFFGMMFISPYSRLP